MVRNAAHDSICACSADEVVDAVLHRYAEARQIGDGLTEQALQAVGRSMATAGPVVVNPTARDRSGMVEVVVPAVGEVGPDVQVLSERSGMPGSITLDGETVRNMLGLLQGARIDDQAYVTDVSLAEDETGLDVTMVVGPEPREGAPIEEVKRELYTRLTARPDTEVRLIIDQPPIRRILARPAPVPGFGWGHFSPAPLGHPVRLDQDDDTRVTLANGLVTVVVAPGDGTFSIDGVARLRPSRGRRRPRRHVQLLAAHPRHGRRHADLGGGHAGRHRSRPRQRRHHRHLRMARVRRRPHPRPGRRPGRHGDDHRGGAGRRATGPGPHPLGEPLPRPPAPGPPTPALPRYHLRGRVRLHRGRAGTDRRGSE